MKKLGFPEHTIHTLAVGLVCLVALVAWPSDHAHAAAVRVTAVTLQETPDELRVTIATSGPARYERRIVRPDWVVIDVAGAELGIPAGALPQSGGSVSRLRVGQFAPDVVRVVVEMTQPLHVRLDAAPDGTAASVRIPARGTAAQSTPITARPGGNSRGDLAKVTGITLWGAPTRPWVTITASGAVRYQRRSLEPNWVVVDVSKAQLALTSGKPPAGRGPVKQIRAAQLAPDVVRVIVELAQPTRVHIAASPDKSAIVVSLGATAKPQAGAVQEPSGNHVQPPTGQPSSPGGALAPGALPPASAQPASNGQPAPGPGGASPSVEPTGARLPQTPGSPNAGRLPAGGYLLGSGDVLEITVWGYGEMTRVVPVRPDGQITAPLAGTVLAAGRSVEQLTQDLTRAFAKYIINPQVTVIVREFRKIQVSLLGQVSHPGTYTLAPGARVLNVISMAAGVTDSAALPQAQLVRASGEARPLSLDALLLQQDMRQNLVLEQGDTIFVPEDTKNKFYVVGDVNHAGVYPLKGEVTVLEALATAGGPVLHGTSTSGTVHIVRRAEPGQGPLTASAQRVDVQPIANSKGVLLSMDLHKMMEGDLRQNDPLRPGDVLVVPAPGVAALPTILSILPFLFWLR